MRRPYPGIQCLLSSFPFSLSSLPSSLARRARLSRETRRPDDQAPAAPTVPTTPAQPPADPRRRPCRSPRPDPRRFPFSRSGPPPRYARSGATRLGRMMWLSFIATGYTLFLYGDRIWQFRFTKPYPGSIYGLFLGDTLDKILSVLGQPYENGPAFVLYRMPFKSYPVRLRLSLEEDRITDVYLYRADF